MDANLLLAVERAVQRAVEPLENRLSSLQQQQHSLENALLSSGHGAPRSIGRPAVQTRGELVPTIDHGDGRDIDPVMTGDLVYFLCKDASGILSGDQAAQRCGVQEQEDRDAMNFDDYIFRV
jgi:hypothetical protein